MNQILKEALEEVQDIISYWLGTSDDLTEEELESMTNIIKGLDVGCSCDSYYGISCGCLDRSSLKREALKEINKIKTK